MISRVANSDKITWAGTFSRARARPHIQGLDDHRESTKGSLESFHEIARELNPSSITIKRRLAKMNQSGAFYPMVDIDPKAVEGGMLGHLVVFYDLPDSRHRVNERISQYLGDQIAFADTYDAAHGFFAR